MYCSNCGKKVTLDDRYCTHCGNQLPLATQFPVTEQEIVSDPNGFIRFPENLGTPVAIWRKTIVASRFKDKPSADVTWIYKEIDIVLTNKVILLVASFPASKVHSVAGAASMLATAGGVGGALLIGLPIAVLGEVYERVFGQHNKLDSTALSTLFQTGRILWMFNHEATLRYFEVKGGLFGQSTTAAVITGSFHHAEGDIDVCLMLGNNIFSSLSHARKEFEKAGFFADARYFKTADEIDRLLDHEYPHPNEWKYADPLEISWCKNCKHHVPLSKWEHLETGTWLSSNKPQDPLIPCGIPVQSIEVWQKFFATPRDQRALYPRQCPLFVRAD